LYAAEQKRADVARARRRWMREQGMFDPARLVFIDETCTNTALVRLCGRAPHGERLVGYAPHGHLPSLIVARAGIPTRLAALVALRIAQLVRFGLQQSVQRLLHAPSHDPVEVVLDPLVVNRRLGVVSVMAAPSR